MKKDNFLKRILDNFINAIWFFWDIKEHLIIILVVIICMGLTIYAICPNPIKKRNNEKLIYRNEKLIIVGTNEDQGITQDKFHKPIAIKIWLVQRIKDTTQFAELKSHNNDIITKELWYSKGIGDTLYFDYIRRDRFFTIKR